MVHLWRPKAREDAESNKVAPGVGATGDIAVIIDGKKLDNELVRLACLMAKKAKRKDYYKVQSSSYNQFNHLII